MNDDDALLRGLRELPAPPVDGPEDERARRAARAAFVRAAEGEPWHARVPGAGRLAVPAVLAAVVFLYLGWAISTVNALAH